MPQRWVLSCYLPAVAPSDPLLEQPQGQDKSENVATGIVASVYMLGQKSPSLDPLIAVTLANDVFARFLLHFAWSANCAGGQPMLRTWFFSVLLGNLELEVIGSSETFADRSWWWRKGWWSWTVTVCSIRPYFFSDVCGCYCWWWPIGSLLARLTLARARSWVQFGPHKLLVNAFKHKSVRFYCTI